MSTFKESLSGNKPPENASVYLKALWYDANGNWNKAHELIQDIDNESAAWIHAYLHRKEGDISNAGYWYRRAGKNNYTGSLDKEWEELVEAFS
ncbi:hypothetical protein BH11BAC3_BH11BAC3_31420 [soil metagenome]